MKKVMSYNLCDLDPKVKVIGKKAGICNGVPSTAVLVKHVFINVYIFLLYEFIHCKTGTSYDKTHLHFRWKSS